MAPQQPIQFVCKSDEHRARGRDPSGGVLTIVGGAWAFCPWGQNDAHAWGPVQNMSLATARTTRFPIATRMSAE